MNFMNGIFGCHAPHLRVLFEKCRQLGHRLSSLGIRWSVRHIYREYNTVADELSKRIANIPWLPESSPPSLSSEGEGDHALCCS